MENDTTLRERPIALVAAMNDELRHALDRMDRHTSERVGPWTLHHGSLAGKAIVAVVTGIGMVNAAAAVTALLTREDPRAVLNFGCAGAHREDIHPGDVIIGSGAVAHLSLTILPTGEERYVGFRYQVDDQTVLSDVIEADSHLLEIAHAASQNWRPDRWPWSTTDRDQGEVHVGVVASADCWTQDPVRIGGLHDLHASLCEDMEAAAIAQVCAMFKVPMIAIKDISNNELHVASSQGVDFPSLEAVSSEVGARAFALAQRIIEHL